MSREIKFRAWDIKNKRFVNIVRLILDQFGALDYAEVVFNGEIYKLYPSEIALEQATGLKDKNGKEIYEGDILRYDAIDYEIYWDCSCTGWNTRRADRRDRAHDSDPFDRVTNYGRIVGNIHENSELLDGVKESK